MFLCLVTGEIQFWFRFIMIYFQTRSLAQFYINAVGRNDTGNITKNSRSSSPYFELPRQCLADGLTWCRVHL